jgi:copper homeostasis protein
MPVARLEIPVEDAETAVAAALHADRLEVCRDLAQHGLTPSPDAVARVRDRVAVLPNPPELAVLFQETSPSAAGSKAGNRAFHGDDSRLATLERLVGGFAEAGATSVVIGFLDAHGGIDREACRSAVAIIGDAGLQTAFHRAFDFALDSAAALRQLSELGIHRTLSAGVRGFEVGTVSLERRLVALKASASAGRATDPPVEVVPCGGVRCDHASRYLDAAGHLHASCLIDVNVSGVRRFSAAEAAGLRDRITDWTAREATG